MARPVRQREPIDFDDVMIALSEAKAAWWLLDALDGDCIDITSRYLKVADPIAGSEEEASEIESWLRSWCLDKLQAALREAEAAYRASAAVVSELRDEALGGPA